MHICQMQLLPVKFGIRHNNRNENQIKDEYYHRYRVEYKAEV